MNTLDLEVMLNKKVRGVAYEEIMGEARLVIMLSNGRTMFFTSESPIDVDMETEN